MSVMHPITHICNFHAYEEIKLQHTLWVQSCGIDTILYEGAI